MERIRLRISSPSRALLGDFNKEKFKPVIFEGILQLSVEDAGIIETGWVRIGMVLTVVGTVGAGIAKETAIELAAKQAAEWIESHLGPHRMGMEPIHCTWRQVHDSVEFDRHGRVT